MFFEILKYIYFFLPAGFANMAPTFVRRICKNLAVPVDFNKKFLGKPLFGPHKTYRGFVFGVIFSIVIAYLQKLLYGYWFFRSISFIDYSSMNVVILGFLMGFGALTGDLVKSFFKRRVNIKPGDRFIPFDQIDWILGMILFTWLIYPYTLKMIIVLIIISFIVHKISRYIGYYIRLNKEKW